MRLPKNLLSNTYKKPDVYLCEVDKTKICKLETSSMQASLKFNSYSELSLEVSRIYNDIITGEHKVNPFYDKIEGVRLLYLEGFGYFEIQEPALNSDGIKESKEITAYSLEYTLSQKYLEDFYINTGEVNSVEVIYAGESNDIVPVTLYNPSNENLSLLHLVLAKTPGWSIGHIDAQLTTLGRQFEVDRESVYDFLMNEVCKKFNCYIVFDTTDNTINVYAEYPVVKLTGDGVSKDFTILNSPFHTVQTVSIDGYKTTQWEYTYSNGTGLLKFTDSPPPSNSLIEVIGVDAGWETDVFVSFENLSQEVKVNYSADDIKTVLTVTYGDNNADIREVNLGLPYITDLSYFYTVDWMGQDLYDAYTAYQEKCNSRQSEYTQNAQEMLYYAGLMDYEENRLSLGYSQASVDETTVGTYYVRGGRSPNFYYTEVSLPSEYVVGTTYYSTETANLTEDKVSKLFEALKKYFNKEQGWYDSFTSLKEEFDFMSYYGRTIEGLASKLKATNSLAEKEEFINEFLNAMWNEIGRVPLKQLYLEPYKKIQIANVEAGWSQTTNDNYWNYYPVVLFIDSIERAISFKCAHLQDLTYQQIIDLHSDGGGICSQCGKYLSREVMLNAYQEAYNAIQAINISIADELLVSNNFSEEQLIKLNAFLREDELHLDHIIETAQDSVSDSFKIKQDAKEEGRIELQRICKPQLQFSMSMANIYALPEFEPIIDQFQLGKLVKVGIRNDYIKQSRLMQVNINFEDFADFSCEFGELTSLRSQSDIQADLLSQAISAGKSVATNASYWTRGSDQSNQVQQKIDAGLLDAVTSIKSIDGTQGVEIDKYGIHLKNIDPNTGEADPEQGWITNNKFLYSDDGFKSTKSVFGKYTYDDNTYYGILAESLVGSLIVGTQIEIGNANGTLKFDDGGFSVTNGSTTFKVDGDSNQLINISNDTEDLFYIDDDGKLHVTGDGKDLDITYNATVSEINKTIDNIELSVNQVQTDISNNYSTTTEMNAAIKLSADGITNEVSKKYATISQTKHYGTCTTTPATAAKVVTCSGFTLYTGASISVGFAYTNTAASPTLNVNGTGAAYIKAYNGNLTSTSSYNWAAQSVVTFIFDGTYWRLADSGALYQTNNLSSKITQTASEIRSEVSATYATKDTLKDYSTTTQMNSAISQSANSITSTVDQKLTGYATVGQAKHYGTCATAASTAAKVVTCSGFTLYTGATISVKFTYKNSADKPTLNVNGTGAKSIALSGYYLYATSAGNWSAKSVVNFIYNGSYWDIVDSGALYQTENLSSQITQTATSIEAEVTRAKDAEATLSSKIAINANAITSKVNSGDFGTLIEQNYDHVKIAWNKNSNYIQFENGAMCIYTSATHNTNTLLMKHRYDGAWYYNNSTTIGRIGTNNWEGDTSYRGLVFNLEPDASYMCWSAADSGDSGDSGYKVKLVYHHKSSKHKQGLHFGCNTYTNGCLYLTDSDRFIKWSSGGCGFNGRMTWCNKNNTNYVEIDGPNNKFNVYTGCNFKVNTVCDFSLHKTSKIVINNGCAVDIWSDINMHNFDIIDADLVTSSDARLKTNIQNTSVDAISLVNQIEMKEFDWIENGEHEDIGMIAQQLQQILPDLVHEDTSTGKLSIKMNKFIPYLIKSIQELTEYITEGASTFSLRRGWVDPYTEEEKIEFVSANACHYSAYDNQDEQIEEELETPEILIPIEQKGEEDNE